MTLKLKNTNFINTVMYKSPILINNIDNNKIVVSNKLPFGKQGNKTKCLYIMMKDEHFFHKYMKIWEKVSNIIKNKFNLIVNLYIIKNI